MAPPPTSHTEAAAQSPPPSPHQVRLGAGSTPVLAAATRPSPNSNGTLGFRLPPPPPPRKSSRYGTGEILLTLSLIVLVIGVSGAMVITTVLRGLSCPTTPTVGTVPDLPADRNANAQAIAHVALTLGLGRQGVLVGITVALTESSLDNVNYGDMMGPGGTMSSSRGLFQQLDTWGPLEDRLDPARAATMFYNGGQAGQNGLNDIPGWEEKPVPEAAQAVQQSEFADGSNYADQLGRAQAITDALLTPGPTQTCITLFAAAPPNAIQLPDDPNVAPEVRGAIIATPTPDVAAGIAAGLVELGQPYVWGGAGDNGCTRGGGAKNSCRDQIGWDCSGLTRKVLLAANATDPGTDSSTQRNPAHAIPWDQGQPGDLVGFPGHIAIYLGHINNSANEYIIEASDIGIPVHIVAITRLDADPHLYRYWA